MKPFLLHRNTDFDWARPAPWNSSALTQDLDLATLLDTMARNDPYLRDVAGRVILAGLHDPAAIGYRQQVLRDCLAHPSPVRQLYHLAADTVDGENKLHHWAFVHSPNSVLHRSVEILQFLLTRLRSLRGIADSNAALFQSDGFVTFFGMIAEQLSDEYLGVLADHLQRLTFRSGVLISAHLGPGNHGTDYVLRTARYEPSRWKRFTDRYLTAAHSLVISDRDEAGSRALSELEDRGINQVANALAQSTDHVVAFFRALRAELGFYVGCLNLSDALSQRHAPLCLPVPSRTDTADLAAEGLCDASLILRLNHPVVGNNLDAAGKSLVVITGANQGGKSTFLRAIGLTLLMMQSGMFVTATHFRASVSTGLYTHYKREEDTTMTSGKLDEELSRMNDIVDHLRPGSTVLLNESFAATNEREGSQIARQIVHALTESGVRVLLVTHLYDLAQSLHTEHLDTALFLRADRHGDGHRTFRIVPGAPLPTSHGADLYEKVFAPPEQPTELVRNIEKSGYHPALTDDGLPLRISVAAEGEVASSDAMASAKASSSLTAAPQHR